MGPSHYDTPTALTRGFIIEDNTAYQYHKSRKSRLNVTKQTLLQPGFLGGFNKLYEQFNTASTASLFPKEHRSFTAEIKKHTLTSIIDRSAQNRRAQIKWTSMLGALPVCGSVRKNLQEPKPNQNFGRYNHKLSTQTCGS